MPLGNYVIFNEGEPERMHFSSHQKRIKDITDPNTRLPRTVNSVDFTVDRLNGQPVQSTLSVIQEKLFALLEPYLQDSRYREYEFIITKRGTGFRTTFTVDVRPLSSAVR